jgi:hypothetical protein
VRRVLDHARSSFETLVSTSSAPQSAASARQQKEFEMTSRIVMLAAAMAAILASAGAAAAAAQDVSAYDVCAVYGASVDPRFCADYVDPEALWVDPVATGGTRQIVVVPSDVLQLPANPTGHADGLRVEGIRP